MTEGLSEEEEEEEGKMLAGAQWSNGGWFMIENDVPLGFVALEDLALGIVANDADVDEAAQLELLRTKTGRRHGGDGVLDVN